MKNFLRKNTATVFVVLATVILASIALFTAFRLYQLREGAPTVSKAWDCNKYVFLVDVAGTVTVRNDSSRNEPAQKAKVYINGQLAATFDVPALVKGQSATLGNVTVPENKIFDWQVVGTVDCQNSGSYKAQIDPCTDLTFSITGETATPTPTAIPTTTPTSTPTATPSISPSPTPTPTATPISYSCNSRCTTDDQCRTANSNYICYSATLTCRHVNWPQQQDCQQPPTSSETPTPAPTGTAIAKATPAASPTGALPEAGISWPTFLAVGVGAVLLILGFVLII